MLADRISIVRQGSVVETGSLAELRHMTRTTVIAETNQPAEHLAQLTGIHDFSAQDGKIRFQLDGDSFDEAMRALTPLGVRSLVAHPPTLEQLLMRHYGDAVHAAEDTQEAPQ